MRCMMMFKVFGRCFFVTSARHVASKHPWFSREHENVLKFFFNFFSTGRNCYDEPCETV